LSKLRSATSRFSLVFPPKREAFAADLLKLLQPADLHRAHPGRLLSDSGVAIDTSRDQACDEGAEQGFAASARIVHELKEPEIKRQLVL